MKRLLLIILCTALLLPILGGCADLSKVTENIADAAAKELEKQLTAALEKHKVEMIELKTTMGNLKDGETASMQFFSAVLIQCESDSAAEAVSKLIGGMFDEAGYFAQTGSAIDHEYLKNKPLSYDHDDFSAGNYYTVYVCSTLYSAETKKGE